MSVKARKWVAVQFGGPEALRNIEADVPEPGPGQVTIGPFRARGRGRVLALADRGDLVVPIAATFPFEDALAAFQLLTSPHPPGKIA